MPARRLLLINKFYHDRGPAGGVGRYLVQEEADLRARGWEVIPFAMAEKEALPSRWDRHFVKARDYSAPRWGRDALGDAINLIWNREAAANLDRLIRESRPDVAHIHNIYHHLSPSILPVLARHRIPVAMTLHDLRLLCPAIHMLRGEEVCERCRDGRLHNAILGKCVKESRAASLLAAVETFHQRQRRLYEETVNIFLCPSDFFRRKFAEWGYPAEKLIHLPNFVDLDFWNPATVPTAPEQDAYLYFGRISREKGLRTLLEAQSLWEKEYQAGNIPQKPLKLLIAGTGPCEGNLKAKVAQLELQSVEILGGLEIADLRSALGRARFSVLPSICYENGPMAALESLAAGIPLMGTDMGGIPEMIQDQVTGIIASGLRAEDLLAGLLRAVELGPAARKESRVWAEQNASRPGHMERLVGILEDLA
ncbi:MAG: glycosyltransferase [Gemmatimonadales bacterium]|nr:glycosyltransferase [Gemmatimonadales bacterium]